MGPAEAGELLFEAADGGGSGAVAVVVGGSARAGSRTALIRPSRSEQTIEGSLGDDALDATVQGLLAELLADPKARDGLHEVEGPAGMVELYVEIRRAVLELIVVGAGHIAQPMAHLGALLGFRVTVVDDRPDFATLERFPDADRLIKVDFSDPFADIVLHDRSHLLLVTRGHKYDYECLIRALRHDPQPAYIGMIGSRRRIRATYVQLVEEGFATSDLDRIYAPVGLDIGAETPEEIAVSVAAELVMLTRGGSGVSLKGVERITERFFKEAE